MSPNTYKDDDDDELLALQNFLSEECEKTEQKDSAEGEAKTSTVDDAELLELAALLSDNEEHKKPDKKVPRLRNDSTFDDAFSYDIPVLSKNDLEKLQKKNAEIEEELNSSDDEEVRNYLERKYNEYGSDMNKRLKQQRDEKRDKQIEKEVNAALKQSEKELNVSGAENGQVNVSSQSGNSKKRIALSNSFKKPITAQPKISNIFPKITPVTPAVNSSVYTDPIFEMRMINPLVPSNILVERMNDKKPVSLIALPFHIQRGDLSKDWVVAGVLLNKGAVRTSKKGDPYSVWRLSDLKGDVKYVSLFVFGSAHKDLWKTVEGTCLAILNPNVFEKRAESDDVACLSIDTSQKVMILGKSKDYGVCKARKKNGEPCTTFVNLSECDFCIYHMKQEYSKMSRRSELQSPNSGRGLNELRNKVLGKSEVFYAGQSFTAVPAKKSAKMLKRDANRLSSLSEFAVSPFAREANHTVTRSPGVVKTVPYAPRSGAISKLAANVETNSKQRIKDLERLKVLQEEAERFSSNKNSFNKSIESPIKKGVLSPSKCVASTSNAASKSMSASPQTPGSMPLEKFKNREFSFATRTPQLSSENFCLEVNVGERRAQFAKMKAAEILKKKPIAKSNPNSIRGTSDGKRRAIDELNDKYECSEAKRQKMVEDQREIDRKSRIQRIIAATSSHTNLIDMREQQEQDKYFNKLEKKEALEEKMLNTYKVPCKAVICQRCKYTAFSAAERCKEERHPLKVVDAEKRFFKCRDCGNRTATVFKIPKTSCKNCKGSNWERTAMIREKTVNTTEELSIRGDEEVFIGTSSGQMNINLLIPTE